MARCLLQAKDLPTKFWAEVVYCSNYVLNLVLTRAVSNMTPVDKWRGQKPSVGHHGTAAICIFAGRRPSSIREEGYDHERLRVLSWCAMVRDMESTIDRISGKNR